jgi:lipoprotein-anchoring transpeptidase ErfK/SrfK
VQLEQSFISPESALQTGNDFRLGSIAKAALRAGVLSAASVFALTAPAHATTWWWPENDNAVYTPIEPAPKRIHRKPPHLDTRQEKLIESQTAKPQGPLMISVSIDQQKLRVYDANGFFAETPVSTGMRGHTTPMGVFSVIQKNKWHRSNIYSGAPMPYMQRITWSGIALHAGVLPGYPASHGCIRMPMSFAMKMWSWTRMGARVIITPGDITLTNFAHALLPTQRPAPPETPVASDPQKPTTSTKSDKAAASEPASDAAGNPHRELRASILVDAPRAALKTADASAPSAGGAIVLSDSSTRPTSTLPAATADAHAEAPADPIASDKATPQPAGSADLIDPVAKASEAEKALPISDNASSLKSADKTDAGSDAAAEKKDQARAPDAGGAPANELPAAKRGGGQIAIFVSGKDQKLYVRQNMTPLFDVPVAIAPGERPLGTHIFTAALAKDDAIRWTVVSLPQPHRGEPQVNSRQARKALAAEVKAPSETESPTAALDRLTIPPAAMARIADAIATGASLTVSDQAIAASGETGQGTDFIIRLR